MITAEVQADRMTKAYHRKWHTGHGKFSALMNVDEFGELDEGIVKEGSNVVKLFGVPGYAYRQLITGGWHWLAAKARRREDLLLTQEFQLRHSLSYISKCYERDKDEHKRAPLAEVGGFMKALLRKKVSVLSSRTSKRVS
jgi:hypothetical protein